MRDRQGKRHGASSPRADQRRERDGARSLVSILIPAYNAAAFIDEALESALQQTHPYKEIVVVDDGSTDDTAGRVGKFGTSVRLVRVPHGGLSWARNHGMRASTGEFVLFLDADDTLAPQLAERAVGLLKARPELAFVFVNVRDRFRNGSLSVRRIPSEAFGGLAEAVLEDPLEQVLLSGFPISPTGLCARREALTEAGYFDETLGAVEDFEYFSRLYLKRPVGYIAEPLATRRHHDHSLSRQSALMIECARLAEQKVAVRLRAAGRERSIPTVRAYVHRGMEQAARDMLGSGAHGQALKVLWRYRRWLWGPRWPLLAMAALMPRSVFQKTKQLRQALPPHRP
jgi:cellulose synthase/poly-beta-1,6-N-acetylglucosamine synthase-like glycosyltransferase